MHNSSSNTLLPLFLHPKQNRNEANQNDDPPLKKACDASSPKTWTITVTATPTLSTPASNPEAPSPPPKNNPSPSANAISKHG